MKVNNRKQTSSSVYVPTARFTSKVIEENKKQEMKKIAYLTFDDGPSQNTEKILEVLEEEDVVATFFLIGNQITPEREKIVKKAIKQGNAVGVHTYSHKKEDLYKDVNAFFVDFDKAAEKIEEVTGEYPILHRFPWGSNNGYVSPFVDELHQGLQRRGIRSYDWNVSGEDSLGDSVTQKTIYNNVKQDLTRFRQPIILLHDAPATEETAKVIRKIIVYIKECGYEFATLEEREEYLFPASWR